MHQFMLPALFILSLIPCCIEVDISAPSFPEISHYFGVSEGKVELTIVYNFLGFWISALLYGPLSECWGRRKVMIAGNALLLSGAFGCGFVSTMNELLVWRFVQGLGASTSAVVVFAMIADVYKGNKAIRLIGIMNATLTLIMAISPLIGSFINQVWGWRGNYFIVAGVSLMVWLLLLKALPETKKNFQKFNFRKILQNYKTLLTSREFISMSLVPSLFYASYMSFVACGSFLYTETFKLSLLMYACHQGVIVAIFSLVSLWSDYIMKVLGKRNCITMGVTISFLSSFVLSLTSLFYPHSPFLITSLMIVFCMGFAICYPIIFNASLELFPSIKGAASSLTMALRALICALVVGLTSFLYTGHLLSIFSVVLLATLLVFVLTWYYLLNKIFHYADVKR
jgi:DHA1 family bicyclomycin/chloramphenicol resistance-like MFS transporter